MQVSSQQKCTLRVKTQRERKKGADSKRKGGDNKPGKRFDPCRNTLQVSITLELSSCWTVAAGYSMPQMSNVITINK